MVLTVQHRLSRSEDCQRKKASKMVTGHGSSEWRSPTAGGKTQESQAEALELRTVVSFRDRTRESPDLENFQIIYPFNRDPLSSNTGKNPPALPPNTLPLGIQLS